MTAPYFYYDDEEDCLIANDPIEDCPFGELSVSDTLQANKRLIVGIRKQRLACSEEAPL